MSDSDQLPVFRVVGFTGHRQLKDAVGVQRLLGEVLTELRTDAKVEWLALSSIAEGADMLFARAALRLGLGWEVMLPMPQVEFKNDFTPEVWRDVESLLAYAEHARVIGERSQRDDAYLDCGMETVNHCDVLLAVWDGERSRGRGGTAEIIAYARDLGRPVIIIDAKTLAVRRENVARMARGDKYLAELNELPAVTPPAAAAAEDDSGRRTVLAFHHKVDGAATKHAPHFPKLITITLAFHLLAAAIAAATLAFNLHGAALPWGKLFCLLAATGAATLLVYRRQRLEWVRYRLAAEITRSALATWGVPRALRLFDDFDWAGLEPLRRALDVLGRRSARAHRLNFDQFKQRYIRERIDGQLAYFSRQQAKAQPLFERLRMGFFACSSLAIFFAAAYAVHSLVPQAVPPPWVPAWVYGFGPIVLPVLAAGFMSLVSVNDLHQRVARCREMHVRLETARTEATFVQTWGALERVVAKAERALLQEVFEWHSITSFSETQ